MTLPCLSLPVRAAQSLINPQKPSVIRGCPFPGIYFLLCTACANTLAPDWSTQNVVTPPSEQFTVCPELLPAVSRAREASQSCCLLEMTVFFNYSAYFVNTPVTFLKNCCCCCFLLTQNFTVTSCHKEPAEDGEKQESFKAHCV